MNPKRECLQCNHRLNVDDRFCPKCGTEYKTANVDDPSYKIPSGLPESKEPQTITAKEGLWIMGILVGSSILFALCAGLYDRSNDSPSDGYTPPSTNLPYSSSSTTNTSSANNIYEPPAPVEKLKLLGSRWERESEDYCYVRGQVKNLSNHSLKNVQVVVTFHDKNGEFVTSEDALIKYNPILVGQTSPFEVIARWNPAMSGGTIEFQHLGGGTIVTEFPEEKQKKKKRRN